MRNVDDLNLRIMLAASIWGVVLAWGHNALVGYLSEQASPLLFQSISRILQILFALLYPVLISRLMRRRTLFWANPLTFSMLGSLLGLMVFTLVRYVLGQFWFDAGLTALLCVFFLTVGASRANTLPVLEQERKDHFASWEELSGLSVLSLMFLQVPSLLDSAY